MLITALFGVDGIGCAERNFFHLGENGVEFSTVKAKQPLSSLFSP